MAFPEIYWAFPFTYLAMAWRRRRQALAKWRLGRRKWRIPRPDPDLGGPGPTRRSSPQAALGHGLAPPPPPGHGQISKWKRPENFRKRHLGCGGGETRRPETDIGVGCGDCTHASSRTPCRNRPSWNLSWSLTQRDPNHKQISFQEA